MVRLLGYFLIFIILTAASPAQQVETVIMEVEGDVEEYKEFIETYHPLVEVVATYSTLFQGIAVQGKPEHLKKMHTEDFVRRVHQVHKYQALPTTRIESSALMEQRPVTTPYTGANTKVAVIDTGVDYTHPDLMQNFAGGYDVFDLDEDPMETTEEEGMPTSHGTHVAGIIAANGEMEGVAPAASIHAYRALGPGGYGSTLHVLAALEQAVRDDVDVINLSLGNNVNGPDYPTSIAVNKAVALGIPVVIANGNSGPAPWTVGSPATAEDAFSVGAAQAPSEEPFLYHAGERKEIPFALMQGSEPWDLTTDYKIIDADDPAADLRGKIALFERGEVTFHDLALKAKERGAVAVLIYNNEDGPLFDAVDNTQSTVTIPVAGVSKEAGEWLANQSGSYLETRQRFTDTTIADFSSRGPVTVDWFIKPDLVAPGTDISSTVPGGYERFNGTSMAAPFVAGAVALLKEAHPNWGVEKIYNALRTTAEPLRGEEGSFHAPSVQGHGMIRPEKALAASTIIFNGTLEAGKISNRPESREFKLKIENLSDEMQQFTFDFTKMEKEYRWNVPLPFEVPPQETLEITLELEVDGSRLEAGVHEGFLPLIEQTENKTYHLPYLFINQHADQPKITGIEFNLKPFSEESYQYSLYVTEELETLSIELYDPDTLTYQGSLLEITDPNIGVNEGEIPRYHLIPGNYLGVLTAIGKDGDVEVGELPILIE